ncbi:hypothetical protein [Gemmobacter denitrificans]|uniref:Excalibur calcium-binding domain-containing protein n=1 Tax=Gemmobacter denitrificans TaxID=3123040 RepID=A0ABU8BTX6_9RHOB
MRRLLLPLMLVSPLALAACAPSVPDSNPVGFDSYDAQREAALNSGAPILAPGAKPIAGGAVSAQPLGAGSPAAGGFSTDRLGAAIDRAAGSPAPAMATAPVAPVAPGQPLGSAPAVAIPAPAAVTPVAPLPQRSGSGGPNLVEFALATTHAVGTPMYERSSLQIRDPAKACGQYPSPEQAQLAFLEAGGPEKDRKGLDPDGDGFACAWDPSVFRNAVR